MTSNEMVRYLRQTATTQLAAGSPGDVAALAASVGSPMLAELLRSRAAASPRPRPERQYA